MVCLLRTREPGCPYRMQEVVYCDEQVLQALSESYTQRQRMIFFSQIDACV
jgi:hypothetical protein